MKVTKTKEIKERKLVAVIGERGHGIFLKGEHPSTVVYFGHNLIVDTSIYSSLTEVLKHGNRIPVYEDEEVVLKL